MIVLLLFVIRIFTYTSQPDPSPTIINVPTTSENSLLTSPFPSLNATTSSEVRTFAYKPGDLKKDTDRITQKGELSIGDQKVRANLLQSVNRSNGVIETTNQFQIEYVPTPNLFMVELRGNNAPQSKLAAEQYFKSQGLSNYGICSLPVVFYLNQQLQNGLIASGQTFNPVPEGCQ